MVFILFLLFFALSHFPAMYTSLLCNEGCVSVYASVCAFTVTFNPPALQQSLSIYRVLGLSPALFVKASTISNKK